ncbi:hypothetical protein ALE3EI_1265 [Constantimarinum furrinae]|uniref:Uncharacterized protein n=1 Tax=Constantimarinum furrinae TaxID=2562285 RepID=A0A7G8PU14_9FLAO|nr:hypothetical protein ALE3EI_1265 [Constantimarinum furrinae]
MDLLPKFNENSYKKTSTKIQPKRCMSNLISLIFEISDHKKSPVKQSFKNLRMRFLKIEFNVVRFINIENIIPFNKKN